MQIFICLWRVTITYNSFTTVQPLRSMAFYQDSIYRHVDSWCVFESHRLSAFESDHSKWGSCLQSASTKLGPYVNDRIGNQVVHSSIPINLAFYHSQTFFTLRQSSNLMLNIHRRDNKVKINVYNNYFIYSILEFHNIFHIETASLTKINYILLSW